MIRLILLASGWNWSTSPDSGDVQADQGDQAGEIQSIQTEAGLFPRDPKRVRELPGIGDYTAGAVLSIAYGLPEPAIDGNVTRVLTRLRGLRGDPKKSALRDKLREIAASMIPVDRPGDFNQALMELGARVCLPSQPRCGECPLERHCEAHRIGIASSLPETAPRAAMIDVPTAAAWIERNGRVLLHRRSASEVLGGLWEFPGLLQTDLAASLPARSNGRAHRTGISRTTARRLMKFLASHLGLKLDHLDEIASVRHVVTFRRIQITLFQGELTGPVRRNDLRWVHHDELARLPQSALTRKLHARALALRAGEIADDKA